MTAKEFIEEIRKIKANVSSEYFFLEYNKEVYDILEENQELKKQLENCYCNRIDCAGRIKDSKLYDSLVQKIENKQQEFIEWLEKEIEAIENKLNRYNELVKQGKETDFEYYESIIDERKFDIYMKTLRKYKEIIGNIYESDISS